MKKLLLGLGAVAAVVAPVASVVACGSKPSINVVFPSKVGVTPIAADMNIAGDDETPEVTAQGALLTAYKNLETEIKNKMPVDLDAFQTEAQSLAPKLTGKSKAEGFKIIQGLFQKEINIVYQLGKVTETVTVNYNGVSDVSTIFYDSSSIFAGVKDDLTNLNEDNMQPKMMDFLKAVSKQLPLTIESSISKLKNNDAIKAWAKDAKLSSPSEAVFLKMGSEEFKLGDTSTEINQHIQNYASAINPYAYGSVF